MRAHPPCGGWGATFDPPAWRVGGWLVLVCDYRLWSEDGWARCFHSLHSQIPHGWSAMAGRIIWHISHAWFIDNMTTCNFIIRGWKPLQKRIYTWHWSSEVGAFTWIMGAGDNLRMLKIHKFHFTFLKLHLSKFWEEISFSNTFL